MSRTFHGRDVFCPVAAHLARGADLTTAGPAVDPASLVRLPDPVATSGEGWLEAEVLTIDRFGNIQLAFVAPTLAGFGMNLRVGGEPAVRGRTFGDAPPGGLVVLIDSAGRVAVAANGGQRGPPALGRARRRAADRDSTAGLTACRKATPSGTPPRCWSARSRGGS